MDDSRFSGQLSQPSGRPLLCRWPLGDQKMAGCPDHARAPARSRSAVERPFTEQSGCLLADGKNHPEVEIARADPGRAELAFGSAGVIATIGGTPAAP